MDQIKAEVGHDMGIEYVPEPNQQQQAQANQDYYNDLKKIS